MFTTTFMFNYGQLDAQVFCTKIIARTPGGYDGLENYLMGYKLPEDLVITPTNKEQFFTPSAKNRYIRSVTVKATS